MKHLKVTSALLAAIMCVTMVMVPVAADETEAPSETQTTEVGDEKVAEENEPEVSEDRPLEDEDKKEAEDAYVAKGKCGKKLKWTLDKNGTLKITGKGAMYNFKELNPFPNTTAPWSKYRTDIKKVVISKGVTNVGDYAFVECFNLTGVSMPDSVKTIGTYAFGMCPDLTTIKLGSGLKTIGICAFVFCGLESIVIPKNVVSIGSGAFEYCKGLKSVSIPASVKTICSGAFEECTSLETVDLPMAGLETIQEKAFQNCSSLTVFKIPLSVLTLEKDAFKDCANLNETYLTLTLGALRAKSVFTGCPKNTLHYYSYKATGDDIDKDGFGYVVTYPAIDGTGTVTLCTVPSDLASVKIPDVVEDNGVKYRVSRIASPAFKNHTALKNVVIGANVTTIDNQAFQGCTNLVSVTGGAKLVTIGTRAFEKCHKLKTFKITSKKLKKIGNYAFSGDKALKTLYLKKTTKLTKSGVKKSLKGSSVKKVKVKKSKIRKYKKIFKKKNCGRKVKVKK